MSVFQGSGALSAYPGHRGFTPYSDGFAIDGPLDPRFAGATWSASGGFAINNPTLNAEKSTNPGLEAPYTAGLANGWNLAGVATLAQESTIVHGGASSQKISGGISEGINQTISTFTAGVWYQTGAWVYVSAGNANIFTNNGSEDQGLFADQPSWQHMVCSGRAYNGVRAVLAYTRTPGSVVYFDDISVKMIVLRDLFATIDTGRSDVNVEVAFTREALSAAHSGLVACLDSTTSPANFLIAYHSSTRLILDKCVSGNYNNLISVVTPYVDGQKIRIVKVGDQVSLFYGGVQVGATQTVADAGLVNNTRHGMFSTYVGNKLSQFSIA